MAQKVGAVPVKAVDEEERLFTVSSTPDALEGSGPNAILVQLKPVAGYKWNLEYPTLFKVDAKAGVSTDKAAYSVAEGSVTATESGADIPIRLQLEKGAEGLALLGNFSLCQEDRCKLFRNEKLAIPLTVK